MNRGDIIKWFREHGNVETYTSEAGNERIRGNATVRTNEEKQSEEQVIGTAIETNEDGTATVRFGNDSANVTDLDLRINDTLERENEGRIIKEEYDVEFSCELGVPTNEVVCPHCNDVNHVPEGYVLGVFGSDPFPCVFCGYPLL